MEKPVYKATESVSKDKEHKWENKSLALITDMIADCLKDVAKVLKGLGTLNHNVRQFCQSQRKPAQLPNSTETKNYDTDNNEGVKTLSVQSKRSQAKRA